MRFRRRRKWSARSSSPSSGQMLLPERLTMLTWAFGAIFLLILSRLFWLQAVAGDEYSAQIQSQSLSSEELIARRGRILVRDPQSQDLVPLAMNASVDELRADSLELPDKERVATALAPLLFGEAEYAACEKDLTLCPEGSVDTPEPEINAETGAVEFPEVSPPTFEAALQKKKEEIIAKISGQNRYALLKRELSPEISSKIKNLKKDSTAAHEADRRRLYTAKQSIKGAIPDYFKGLILHSKPIRYYPENELAAQVVGFVNRESYGQYGVEEKMSTALAGEKGAFLGRTDTLGRSIGLSVEDFQKAIDGSDVVLTLDRVIQKKAEELLSESVPKFKADSGQIIVMDPHTGFILALANAPTFNPNDFGSVYALRRTTAEDRAHIFFTTPLFRKEKEGQEEKFVPATFEEYEEAWKLEFDPEFYVYENWWGPGVYLNKTVQLVYEPGSVFKPLVMSVALNEGEVTPATKYFEEKPVEVDVGGRLVPIRNADKQYKGWQTMTNVLERSANLGMVFVARQLGKGVMYEYLKNFEFGRETFVELAQELGGTLNYYTKWSTAALFNTAFGQGISATPLQVIRAWCALANHGQMPAPHIVAEIRHPDGKIEQTEASFTNVLKADTSQTITSMLVAAVNNGFSKRAKIPGYRVAGKTGTSQIARTDGVGYEPATEPGHVITSFVGYAPAEDPKFVVLVKFDRPRFGTADSIWGENTAAPVFKELTEFLLSYYNVPPDPTLLEE